MEGTNNDNLINLPMENLKRDKNDCIILTNGKYNKKDVDVGEYMSVHSWIELKDSNKGCLIKNFPFNIDFRNFTKYNGTQGINISKYNNILVPYIGTEIFNVETAKYFFAKFAKGKQKIAVNPYLEYIITLDEKSNGEEVWEGINILFETKKQDTLVFSERLQALKKFLELRHIATHCIDYMLNEFIRQEIFKKSVSYNDDHNVNWSIGVKGKNVRVFPAYDFDFCSGITNGNDKETLSDNGNKDLKSFIKQYQNLPWMKKYIEEVIGNFDIESVIKIAQDETKFMIPEETKKYYTEFYSQRKKEMEAIYRDVLQTKGDEEVCI